MQAEVIPNGDSVYIRHIKKHARQKSVAAVMLSNVSLKSKAVGKLTGEFVEPVTWDGLELPEAIKSRFRTARFSSLGWFDTKTKKPVTQAKVMVALGNSFYYLP